MGITRLSTLFLSTFLFTSVDSIAYGEHSDYINGIGAPQDDRSAWVSKGVQALNTRAEDARHRYSQAVRFWGEKALKGTAQDLEIGRHVCRILERDADRKDFLKIFFEGSYGEHTLAVATMEMKGVPQTGQHIALARQIGALSTEIEGIEGKISAQPIQKKEREEEQRRHELRLQEIEKEERELSQRKMELDETQKSQQDKAHLQGTNVQHLQRSMQQPFDALEEEKKEPYKALEEELARLKRQREAKELEDKEKGKFLSPSSSKVEIDIKN